MMHSGQIVAEKYSQRPPRVLFVDDDEDALELWSRYLCQHGYTAEVAKNGSEADFKTAREVFDLIITDMEMPYMTGFELVKSMRAGTINQSTPVIVMSGHLTRQAIVQLNREGVSKIFTKPVKVSEFLSEIGSIIGFESKPAEPKNADDDTDDEDMEVAC